jgi:hypothetical protein
MTVYQPITPRSGVGEFKAIKDHCIRIFLERNKMKLSN